MPLNFVALVQNDFDAYVVKNTGLGLLLDLEGSNGDEGTPIIMSSNVFEDTSQKWTIVDEGNGLSFQAVDPNRNVYVSPLNVNAELIGAKYQKTIFFLNVPGDDTTQFQLTTEPNQGLAWQAVGTSQPVVLGTLNNSEPNQLWKFEGVILD